MKKQDLFGISFSVGSFENLLDSACGGKGNYACFCNAHMVYEHHNNPHFKNVLKEADFVFPDGMPLVYSLQWLKKLRQERIAGNDAIEYLLEKAARENLKVFFFGGSTEVLELIKEKVLEQGIVSKYYSPPFLPIEQFDIENQAEMIREFDPDVVLVGLGCPKQEMWMSKMKGKIRGSMFGIGGAFLLYAGVDSRAPQWMRSLSLEWAYRLMLEPKRLFKRYLITNSYFCVLFFKELLKKIF